MQKRLKTGCCLVLLYAVFTLISSAVRVVPQVSGLRLEAMLSLPYGLIFGRLGAISAAFGSALALFLVGANLNQIPLEFLAALISAYLPFRVWQGMKSPQEPRLALYDQRTVTMFVILGLLAVAPMAVYPAVGAEIYQVVPFSASFFKILLPTLLLPWQAVSSCTERPRPISLQERAKPCGDAWKIRKPLPGIWRWLCCGLLLPGCFWQQAWH